MDIERSGFFKKYQGLLERMLEIRLANALHRNGIIDLLDKLNLCIVRKNNFTGINETKRNVSINGNVLRCFKAIRAEGSKIG